MNNGFGEANISLFSLLLFQEGTAILVHYNLAFQPIRHFHSSKLSLPPEYFTISDL